MNQKMQKTIEHYDNCEAIARVLSLLKNLPCDNLEQFHDINLTRRMLTELQRQEQDINEYE